MHIPVVVVATLLLFSSSTAVQAATWYIASDGSGDAPTIQAGIDSAAAGDTILLADGTFNGIGNRNIDFHGKDLVLISENGPEFTILDCEGMGRGIHLHGGVSPASRIEGITIMNGSEDYGGGILIDGTTTPVDNCWILNNTASSSGGGIHINGNAHIGIANCLIAGNSAPRGGGLSWEDVHFLLTLENCVISGNEATSGNGGGIAVSFGWDDAIVSIQQSTIAGNQSSDGGGGIAVGWLQDPKSFSPMVYVELLNSILWGNCAPIGREILTTGTSVAYANCSCVDSTGSGLNSWVEYSDCQFEEPLFCSYMDCSAAPTTGNDCSIASESPCAPINSGGCGLIGALDVGCTATSVPGARVEETSWGAVKGMFR